MPYHFHSITFRKTTTEGAIVEQNTWLDWHLIPSNRPDIDVPSQSFNYVDIPGKDGSLDISNYLNGRPSYSDRSGSWQFIVVQEYDGVVVDSRSWIERRTAIMNFLSGVEVDVFLEDQSQYYYTGRVYIDSGAWQTGASFSTITINYRLKPFKYRTSNGKEAGI